MQLNSVMIEIFSHFSISKGLFRPVKQTESQNWIFFFFFFSFCRRLPQNEAFTADFCEDNMLCFVKASQILFNFESPDKLYTLQVHVSYYHSQNQIIVVYFIFFYQQTNKNGWPVNLNIFVFIYQGDFELALWLH